MRSGHFILENVLYNIPLFFFYNYATVSGMKFWLLKEFLISNDDIRGYFF